VTGDKKKNAVQSAAKGTDSLKAATTWFASPLYKGEGGGHGGEVGETGRQRVLKQIKGKWDICVLRAKKNEEGGVQQGGIACSDVVSGQRKITDPRHYLRAG